MDPPSAQLIERLRDLRLCRPGDLRRCRPRVRRLARDLPTFDSVWIDALVQTRRLTPFQARVLESADPGRLSVGPFILLNHLGNDGRITRFLAREKDGRQLCLLSRIRCPGEHPAAALDRVREITHVLSGVRQPSLNPPLGCALQDDLLTVVSPFVKGPTFAELLVRRGRFPDSVIRDVAAQLSTALASLEAVQLVHGDLRMRNVVLGQRGRAVLLHPGLLAAIDPELTIHAELPPDACDTVAPERIGTRAPASTASDMYGLGCLLFELVAGRPPFPQGDPLTKLAAHQSQRVPDVRRFAPETPDSLAGLLSRLTARDPGDRPDSFAELSRELRRRGTGGRLKRFAATFQHPVRIRRAVRPASPVRRAVIPLLLLCAAVNLALLHAGARTELLSIADSFKRSVREAMHGNSGDDDGVRATGDTSVAPHRQPIPTDVVDGVLTLPGPGPYAAGRLAAVGPLIIRGDPADRPVIIIENEPLKLWAEQIQLENVIIRSNGARPGPSTLIAANCQDIGLRNCTLAATDMDIAGLSWSALDDSSAAAPRVAIVDCLLAGTSPTLRLESCPASMRIHNVLQLSGGALIEFQEQPVTTRAMAVTIRQTTLRGSGGLLRFATTGQLPAIVLTLESTAIDLIPDRSALMQFAGEPPADWQARVRITGQDSLVRPGTTLAAVVAESGAAAQPLDASRLAVDGLFAAEFSFAGADVRNPAHAAISNSQLIGHSLTPPGADTRAFSLAAPDAYNAE